MASAASTRRRPGGEAGQVEYPRKPLEHAHHRPVVDGRAGRPERGHAKAHLGGVDRVAGLMIEGGDTVLVGATGEAVDEVREGVARHPHGSPDLGSLAGRPQQDGGEGGDGSAHGPAADALAEWAVGRRQRHGEDEGQRHGEARGLEVAPEYPDEADHESDHGRRHAGQHDPLGDQRGDDDEARPDGRHDEVAEETARQRAAEIGEAQRGERPEADEHARRAEIQREPDDGEQRRRHDCHAQSPAQEDAVRVVHPLAQERPRPRGQRAAGRRSTPRFASRFSRSIAETVTQIAPPKVTA